MECEQKVTLSFVPSKLAQIICSFPVRKYVEEFDFKRDFAEAHLYLRQLETSAIRPVLVSLASWKGILDVLAATMGWINLRMFRCYKTAVLFVALYIVTTPSQSFEIRRSSSACRKFAVPSSTRLHLSTKESSLMEQRTADKTSFTSADQPEKTSSRDSMLYGLLATIQLLPPLALVELPEDLELIRRPVSYIYFVTTATILVILGSKRQDLKQPVQQKPISLKSAVLAPAASSVVIFTIYLLLKYTSIEIYFDRVYQLLGKDVPSNDLFHAISLT